MQEFIKILIVTKFNKFFTLTILKMPIKKKKISHEIKMEDLLIDDSKSNVVKDTIMQYAKYKKTRYNKLFIFIFNK